MVSEARTIELTVVSATNLKKVKKFKQQCYVVAYIYGAQRQATHSDPLGGVNPTWNAAMTLTCYETDLHPDGSSRGSSSSPRAVTVDLYCHSSGVFSRGDKLVGSVVVPLLHIATVAQVQEISVLAFDVRRPSGKVKGRLNLMIKLGEKHTIIGEQQTTPFYAYQSARVNTAPMTSPLVTSYNTASGAQSIEGVYDPRASSFNKDKVVTGYPVGYGAPGYGFDPLGALPRAQQVGQSPTLVNATPLTPREMRRERKCARRERKRARRAEKAAVPPHERKLRRRRRMTMGAMVVGGLILGLALL